MAAVSDLESAISPIADRLRGSSMTAATTSGPAQAPRPASSIPATCAKPARASTRSYPVRPAARRGVYPGCRTGGTSTALPRPWPWRATSQRPGQPPPQPQLEPGERDRAREPEPNRHRRGHRAGQGGQGGGAMDKTWLLEGGGNGQHRPPADRGHDHEGAPYDPVLRDGAVPGILLVTARVVRHAAVISHHPQAPGRHGDVEPDCGRRVAGVEIRLLFQRHPVDRDAALRVTAHHMIAGYPDHALDVVMHARGGAEQAGYRVPQPHQGGRGLRRHRV